MVNNCCGCGCECKYIYDYYCKINVIIAAIDAVIDVANADIAAVM